MTAVKAPPTASVSRLEPATRSATSTATTTAKTRRMRKPTVPAVAGSIRRKSVGPQRAAEVAGELPAEREQRDRGDDPHRLVDAEELARGKSRATSDRRRAAARARAAAIRARLTARALSWRARPASRHEWLRVSNICFTCCAVLRSRRCSCTTGLPALGVARVMPAAQASAHAIAGERLQNSDSLLDPHGARVGLRVGRPRPRRRAVAAATAGRSLRGRVARRRAASAPQPLALAPARTRRGA